MSIFAEIRDKVHSGQIRELVPSMVSDVRYRRLYLAEALWEALNKEHEAEQDIERYAALTADLEVFINRKNVTPEYLFGLSPKGCAVWEIRSLVNPQMRVFGSFICKDCFLATH